MFQKGLGAALMVILVLGIFLEVGCWNLELRTWDAASLAGLPYTHLVLRTSALGVCSSRRLIAFSSCRSGLA
jgi:hypothetical protein